MFPGSQGAAFFVKLLSCLSHSNAAVERGFSVNKECLVENLKEDSLVAQRVVHDAVLAAGGIAQVDITDRMVKTVRSAYSVYREQLQTKKRERDETTELEKKKKRAAALIKELQEKKQRLLSEAQLEASILQDEINSLKP